MHDIALSAHRPALVRRRLQNLARGAPQQQRRTQQARHHLRQQAYFRSLTLPAPLVMLLSS